MDLNRQASLEGSVILDAQKPARKTLQPRLFHSPSRVLEAWQPQEVRDTLRQAEQLAEEGFILAGYISYEAGLAFDLTTHSPPPDIPLIWLGVYSQSTPIPPEAWQNSDSSETTDAIISDASFNVTKTQYLKDVERVREWIAAGDTYQVNLACKYRFRWRGAKNAEDENSPSESDAAHAFDLYRRLRRAHPVPYGAYLNLGQRQILSLSPELFLHREGRSLSARPMKGTIRRGLDSREDERLRRALSASEKDRAENVMIVDLMRNDLGRVCQTGSIRVPRLFKTERYDSVYQMTSDVTGRLREECGLLDILEATFPCGSITGAPKRRTMEIIRELEKEPRGVYCGAIGQIGPGHDFRFSVAIRTLLHRPGGRCELGVGSGVTWSSEAESEWRETQLKSRFLTTQPRNFSLIETLLLQEKSPGGEKQYAYLDEHLARLERSARYWNFPFPRTKIRAALDSQRPACIVRLALAPDGQLDISTRPLLDVPEIILLRIHSERVDSKSPLLYHKTDRRALNERALAQARDQNCFEALLLNENGHLTEGSFTNLFLKIEGIWFTPPLSDGLLSGIWRRQYMKEKNAREKSLTLEDLAQCQKIMIGNSVRGALEAHASNLP